MTITIGRMRHLLGVLVGTTVLLAGAARVDAQQTGYTGTAASSQRSQSETGAAPKRKNRNATTKPRAGARATATAIEQPRPWSLEDALPDNRYSKKRWTDDLPRVSKPELGRVPLERGQGSFGFESETAIKPNQLYDGQPTPGLETVKRDPPSYFGLSLSVPSQNKTLLPPPIVPPWGAPE